MPKKYLLFQNKAFYIFVFGLLLAYFFGCSHLGKLKVTTYEFLDLKTEQELPTETMFKGLPVGGLSSLTYEKETDTFYALSDSKKDHRIYKLSLKRDFQYEFEIKDMMFLKSPRKNRLNRSMDPEAFVFYDKNTVLIASEGQQIFKKHDPTQIFAFRWPDLTIKSVWPVEPVFWPVPKKRQDGQLGQQENQGFESLTLNETGGRVWTATEKSLFQDLKTEKYHTVRLSEFDISSHKLVSQHLYLLKNYKMGLTSLYFLKNKRFLALEREFDGVRFSASIFLADCMSATDVKDQITLKGENKACFKKRIWSSKKQGLKVDNLEALAIAPAKTPDRKLLILASDNNFRESQKTQFLFFEFSTNSLEKFLQAKLNFK